MPTHGDRRRLDQAFGELLDDRPELRDRTQLLVAELLSRGPVPPADDERLTIRIFADADALRVEVHDGGRGAVLRRIRGAPDARGRGWTPSLMNRVADRWGLVSDQRGAWVWFELSLRGGGA